MTDDGVLIDLVDFVYAAVLDDSLWPVVLAKLAAATGAAQAVIATLDRRAHTFASIQRRAYPDLLESYTRYWAFHNPLWIKSMARPAGEVFSLDALMPRQDFAKAPIFNEWWQPAGYSLAMLGTNLHVEDMASSLVCVINARGNDALSPGQARVFEMAARHVVRAARLHRQLWTRGAAQDAAPERFENLRQGAILVDGSANVLFANAAAQVFLQAGDGLALEAGRLAATGGAAALERLVASCGRAAGPLQGPFGGELAVPRGPHRPPLRLTVMPLRSGEPAAEMPWLGLRAPAAIVTINDSETGARQLARELRSRFGLTLAEAALAAEIVKGDGREAAARRRGISIATARAQLSSIFEKTGTRRQAELVRLMIELAGRPDPRDGEKSDA